MTVSSLLCRVALAGCAIAAACAGAAAQSAAPVSSLGGEWLLTADMAGTPLQAVLSLKQDGEKLTGTLHTFGPSTVEGTVIGGRLRFHEIRDTKVASEYEGTLTGERLTGTAMLGDQDPAKRLRATWSARRLPAAPAGPPQRHEFVPQQFYRTFSPLNEPVLYIRSGDTVHTTTVDAAGTDEKGVRRALGGNPQTGPFFIYGAARGDVLKIKLLRVRLNRDWAISDDALVARATGPGLVRELATRKHEPGDVRWKLDRERGVATSEKPGEHLKNFAVPIRPMLGCIAVAPSTFDAPPPTGDSGDYGGNMDFNEIGENATVYLPVSAPGALLYIGDGHALQGDGELNGNALETSLDVEFTVEIVKDKRINQPRVETDEYIMTMGHAGSLDDALRPATGAMALWLMNDYHLTPSEAAQVLGTSVEYRISEVADRNVGVVARLRKDRLAMLTK
jgi:acetamidase/formamidase